MAPGVAGVTPAKVQTGGVAIAAASRASHPAAAPPRAAAPSPAVSAAVRPQAPAARVPMPAAAPGAGPCFVALGCER